ncbi:MAG: tetratricopeptide repeat protein [Marinicellaceae bacterium]
MSLLSELKRRNVFRVTAAYVVICWLLLQVGDVVFEALELEASANRLLMAFVLLGLIPTVLFSWAFEMTPDGIKLDKDVERTDENINHEKITAKKLDYVTLFVLILVGCMSLWLHWSDDEPEKTTQVSETFAAENVVSKELINDKSLAILPFTNVASTEENEPFTIGIHDDLITSLSKISALKVISRTSVLKYSSIEQPIHEIAKKLRVAHIVEGGVQRVGNLIRLNVKLVDAKTDDSLWAETYNIELTTTNIFEIQTEVSQKIANALEAQLTDDEVKSLGKKQTQNIDAYNAYLAGRQRLLIRSSQSLKEALELFEKATEIDPEYALAYVGQADAWGLLNAYSNVSKEEMLLNGEQLVKKALSLDPNLAEAYTSQANYFAEKREFDKAKEGFEKSLKLNPNYATTYHWYGNLVSSQGDNERALSLYRKGVELDPISPVIQTNIGNILKEFKRYQEALDQYDRIIELEPEYPGAYRGKAEVYSAMGKLDETIIWQLKSVELDPGNVYRKVDLASKYIDIGLDDLAEETINEIEDEFPDFTGVIYAKANLDMYRGNYQQAAARFEKALEESPQNFGYMGNLLFYKMILKEYDEAIAGYLKMYPGEFGKEFSIQKNNIDSVINLIWLWQANKQEDKAKQLSLELKQFLSEYPELNSTFYQAMLAAVDGEYQKSAELFFSEYKSGFSREFWKGDHLPMLEEVTKLPFSQEISNLYEYELAQQRIRILAFLDTQ